MGNWAPGDALLRYCPVTQKLTRRPVHIAHSRSIGCVHTEFEFKNYVPMCIGSSASRESEQ